MGCAVSLRKSAAGEGDDDLLVSVCRERKRLMKSVVDRRHALAGAHCKYNQSLYAVALAIRLFVARHSSSPSQFLITFPKPSPNTTMNLHRTQSKPTTVPAAVINAVEEEEPAEEEESGGPVCEHFYDDGAVDPTPAVMTSSSSSQQNQNDFGGWDFFNPFENLMVNGDGGGGYEEGQKLAGDEGGRDVKVAVEDANVSLGVIDAPSLANDDNNGRELLEALKDVEDHFLKAYECGVEFSKMLEFTNVGTLDHLGLDFVESKGTTIIL